MKAPVRHFLLEWRKHARLTQGQVAEGIGYERSYYSRIENGHRPYDQDILEKLAELYGVEPRDLIGRDPATPDDLWTIARSLPADELVRLSAMARALAGLAT